MKRKIFYSIEVECDEQDILQFVELKRPSKEFCYEYTELVLPDIDTKSVVNDLFKSLGAIFRPEETPHICETCGATVYDFETKCINTPNGEDIVCPYCLETL